MGVLIETPVFYEHLSARESLEIHLAYMGCGTADIDNSLQMVGLADTGKKPVSKFSLGMKQRLAIARAILLFTYPINRKTVVWAKIKLLLLFVSVTTLVCTFGGFIVFTLTGHRSYVLSGGRQIAVYRSCFSLSECSGTGMPYGWDCPVLSTDWIHKKIQFNDSDQCNWVQYAVGESGRRH